MHKQTQQILLNRQQLDNTTSGTSILSRPDSAQLFFVYPGKRRAVAGANPMFLLNSGLGDRNIAFVRDAKTSRFETGIDDALPTFNAVLDWHKHHIESLRHVREVYTVGNSGGGYSALMFGHLLRVKTVFAFCPRDPRRGPKLRRLLARWNGVTRYHVYYSENDSRDAVFAARLDGVPYLSLHASDPRHNDDHNIMAQMANRGELNDIFPPSLKVQG